MLPVPFGHPPRTPVEMPNQSAVTVRCRGTVIVTLISRRAPGRTWKPGRELFPAGEAACPLTATVRVTAGMTDGHDAPGGHCRGGEQPPAAGPPTRSAAITPIRKARRTAPV